MLLHVPNKIFHMASLKWRCTRFVGIVGRVLEKRLLKTTRGYTTMKVDESITSSSICLEPSMDTQSHVSVELHDVLVHDYLSDADTGTESEGN